jgi:hypothetical protein
MRKVGRQLFFLYTEARARSFRWHGPPLGYSQLRGTVQPYLAAGVLFHGEENVAHTGSCLGLKDTAKRLGKRHPQR